MSDKYTRQRQGRDFSIHNYLRTAEMSIEGNYNSIDGIIDDSDQKKSIIDRLDYFKSETERNSAPVDGHEPPERGR